MKNLSLLLLSIIVSISAYGQGLFQGVKESQEFSAGDSQDTEKFYSMSDPQFEWSQFQNKKGAVLLTDNGLMMECKEKDLTTMSVTELPLNVESDEFSFGATFNGPKLNEETQIGIVFDYSDSRNYKGIAISKKEFSYFIVKDGISSNVKTGLIKYKGNSYTMVMSKVGDKVSFILNDIEFTKLNRVKIENNYFGLFIIGKGKTTVSRFFFDVTEQEDTEQSTTDM